MFECFILCNNNTKPASEIIVCSKDYKKISSINCLFENPRTKVNECEGEETKKPRNQCGYSCNCNSFNLN